MSVWCIWYADCEIHGLDCAIFVFTKKNENTNDTVRTSAFRLVASPVNPPAFLGLSAQRSCLAPDGVLHCLRVLRSCSGNGSGNERQVPCRDVSAPGHDPCHGRDRLFRERPRRQRTWRSRRSMCRCPSYPDDVPGRAPGHGPCRILHRCRACPSGHTFRIHRLYGFPFRVLL